SETGSPAAAFLFDLGMSWWDWPRVTGEDAGQQRYDGGPTTERGQEARTPASPAVTGTLSPYGIRNAVTAGAGTLPPVHTKRCDSGPGARASPEGYDGV